jgi:signal transduction histidine kinase
MYAEMLASGMVDDPPRRGQYLQTLVTESDRLAHLIENVLAYSRLENKLSKRNAESLTITQLLDHALPSLRRRAEQSQLPLSIELPPEVASATYRTDPVAVQQILLNLVDNACKYGGAAITLSASAHPNYLELAVSDQGPGIPASARLFTAFSKSKTDPIPGIGLGLYLSRQLARDLGGDLEHRPTPAGTTFALTLPL